MNGTTGVLMYFGHGTARYEILFLCISADPLHQLLHISCLITGLAAIYSICWESQGV